MHPKIELKEGDITELEVDAIVNAANNDLILGGGVAGAIRRKGGEIIQEECDKIGSIPVGEAIITSGGNLKAKIVIHAASMSLGSWTTQSGLRNATKNALLKAEEKEVKKIAFPAIGTGIAGFAPDKCAEIMLKIISVHLSSPNSKIEKVYIVLYDNKMLKIFEEHYNVLFLNEKIA